MRSLWILTKKNLKLLLRSKGSALIIIFAPLLIILLLGLSYNTNQQYGLNLGIIFHEKTEDVNSFINILKAEEFRIIEYGQESGACIEDIKTGKVHTCIELPSSLQIEGNQQKEVTFYIDPSRINLVWMVQETVKDSFNLKSQQLSLELTQEILQKLASTKETIANNLLELNTLKEKVSSASGSVNSVKDDLSKIDTKKVSDGGTIKYDSEILSEMVLLLEESIDKIEDAKDSINSLEGDNEEKDAIRGTLNSAKGELTKVYNSISGNGTDDFGGIISSIQADLNATEKKLMAAAASIENTNMNLAGVSKSLKETIDSLTQLDASLSQSHAILSGQMVTEAGTISSPLVTKINKVGEEGTYLNYLFPALLVLVIMFSSILLGTALVMMEKNSPAYLRNFFLPVNRITFILSTYFTNMIITFVEIIIILGLSLVFLKESLPILATVALILFLGGTIFTLLGMIVGYLFTSEETGVLASISLGSLLLFFSGVIIPLEGVSPLLRNLTFLNPFVIIEKSIREILLFDSSLPLLGEKLLLLFSYIAVLFIIILIIDWFMHKHLMEHLFHKHHLAHRQKEKIEKKDV